VEQMSSAMAYDFPLQCRDYDAPPILQLTAMFPPLECLIGLAL
jgi:hypothetical protein